MKLSDFKPNEVGWLLHRKVCMRKGTRTYRIFPSAYARAQVPEKELATRSPDEPVVTQVSHFHKRKLVPLGSTDEYKEAIKKYPPVSKTKEKTAKEIKAEEFMSWVDGNPKKATRKNVNKGSEERPLPDGLKKLFATFNSDVPEHSPAAGVTKSGNKKGASNKNTKSREGYEVLSHIQEMAKNRGIENAYQLWQKVGGSKESAAQLWRGDFKKVGISTLKKLCDVLDCGVGDLLVYEPSTASRTS